MSKYVNSRVVLNKSIIKNLERASVMALEQTGAFVLNEAVNKEVIPFDVGTLQDSGYVNTKHIEQGNVQVAFNTPYARRLYFHPEYNFQTVNNANAKGKWLEDWAEGGQYADKVKKAYALFFKKLGGLK